MTKIRAYVEQLLEDCEIQYQSWVEASAVDTVSPPRDVDIEQDLYVETRRDDVVIAFPLDATR